MAAIFCGVILASLFSVVCGQSYNCGTINDVTEYFWSNDVNGLTSSQYSLNWQRQVSYQNSKDEAPERLFAQVDEEALLGKPTVTAFLAVLDNYNLDIGTGETVTDQERAEVDHFYTTIRTTAVFDKLVQYLNCTGLVGSENEFRSKFYELWFDLYNRKQSSNVLDSSGLEHMIGELRPRGQGVCGLHTWIRFYLEEKAGNLNYYGYVRRKLPQAAGVKFRWRGQLKPLASFFLGSSPELDLAVYTLCALHRPGGLCHVSLAGVQYAVQTFDIPHRQGRQVGTAFVRV